MTYRQQRRDSEGQAEECLSMSSRSFDYQGSVPPQETWYSAGSWRAAIAIRGPYFSPISEKQQVSERLGKNFLS